MHRREFSYTLLGALGAMAVSPRLGAQSSLRVNAARLNAHLAALAEFGKNPQGGVSRVAYSDADRQGREYAMKLMREAQLDVTIDAAGNITGRRKGSDAGRAPLVIEYRRDVMTPRLQAALLAAGDENNPDAIRTFLDIYARIIVTWNLTDDDGETIGTDVEALNDVRTDVLALIVREIAAQSVPDPTNGVDSSNGSLAAVSSVNHQSITS